MYVFRTFLGSILAIIGILTALSGSILWVLYIELITNPAKYSQIQTQFFIQNFGPKVFLFLVILGILKATIGIKTILRIQKAKPDYGFLLSEI